MSIMFMPSPVSFQSILLLEKAVKIMSYKGIKQNKSRLLRTHFYNLHCALLYAVSFLNN